MCTGAESRGDINGDHVVSKVGEDYNEDRMRTTIEGSEGACNSGTIFIQGLLHRLHNHLIALLPGLSPSEVCNLSLTISLCLGLQTATYFLLFFLGSFLFRS